MNLTFRSNKLDLQSMCLEIHISKDTCLTDLLNTSFAYSNILENVKNTIGTDFTRTNDVRNMNSSWFPINLSSLKTLSNSLNLYHTLANILCSV